MASYNGTSVMSPHQAEDTLRCSASIAAMAVDNPVLYEPIASVVPVGAGTVSINTPITELKQAWAGGDVPSFLDDYYYRIHINPASFALGAILSPLEEEFIVWNSWFELKTCSAINKVNPEEFTLDPETAPFSLVSLEWQTFTLGIPMEGSLEFESSITFVFPMEPAILLITGTRVTIFAFEPIIPMRESLEWKTSIMKGKNGSEQRMILRSAPRQIFDINTYFPTEQLQGRFDAKLFGWQKRVWGVPIWSEWVKHTDPILVNDTTVYLDTTKADYRDDSSAIIWQSPTSYEAVKIATVAADRLNLNLPIRDNWIGTKWIMPMRIANMIGAANRRSSADGRGNLNCRFLVSDNILLTTYSPLATYKGLPVVTVSTLLDNEEIEINSDGDASFVDYELNRFQMFSDSDYNIVVQSHIVRRETKAACWDFREFLHSLYGRRGAFWVLTDKADLVLQEVLGAASTSFYANNIKLADNMGLNSMRTHLAFVFPDGRQYYREIKGITESDSDTEILSIDSALGVEVHPGDCEICFLDKMRLSEDTIEIEWEKAFQLRCKFNVTRIVE